MDVSCVVSAKVGCSLESWTNGVKELPTKNVLSSSATTGAAAVSPTAAAAMVR